MRIVRAYGEITELIFSRTRTVLLLCWLQQARHRPAPPAGAGHRKPEA